MANNPVGFINSSSVGRFAHQSLAAFLPRPSNHWGRVLGRRSSHL